MMGSGRRAKARIGISNSCKNPRPKVLGKGDRVDMFDGNQNEHMNLSADRLFPCA
jgi:hypothetical protein